VSILWLIVSDLSLSSAKNNSAWMIGFDLKGEGENFTNLNKNLETYNWLHDQRHSHDSESATFPNEVDISEYFLLSLLTKLCQTETCV